MKCHRTARYPFDRKVVFQTLNYGSAGFALVSLPDICKVVVLTALHVRQERALCALQVKYFSVSHDEQNVEKIRRRQEVVRPLDVILARTAEKSPE